MSRRSPYPQGKRTPGLLFPKHCGAIYRRHLHEAYHQDGTMKPEFISPGFASMLQRTVEEARRLFDEDVFAGIHLEDVQKNWMKLQKFLKSGKGPVN